MKKALLTKLMLLLCALIAGSSSVWADTWEEESLANLTSTDVFVIVGNNYAMTNDNGTNSAPAAVEVTVANGKITSAVAANIQWNVSGNATNGYTFYPNGSTKTWLYCNTTASSGSNNNMRVGTGERKVFELNNSNIIVTKDGNTARYLSLYNNSDWRGYVNTNSATAIKFYKRVISANTCATPTFSPAAGTYTSAQNVTISTTTDGATIYYTTDGTNPTTGSSVYSGTIPVSTTTTIKAMAVKTNYDNSEIATANYRIVTIEHEGTQADPYTVADARNVIDINTRIENVYVTGIVCNGGSSLNSGKMNYYISDDGTTTDRLEAFRGKNLNNTDFTATTDVKVGDVVTIYGTLTKFESTYEFEDGNYITSHKVKPATPTFSPGGGLYTSAQSVTLSCETEGATIYYTTNGTNPTSGSTTYSTAITVNSDMTIKAIAIKDDMSSDIATANYTISLNLSNVYNLVTSIVSGKHYIIVGENNNAYKAMGIQGNNNRGAVTVAEDNGSVAFADNAGVCEFVIYGPDANGRYSIYDETNNGYLYTPSNSANNLKTQQTNNVNGKWTIAFDGNTNSASIVADGSTNRNVMQYNSTSSLFACYASASQGAVYLYEKNGEAAPTVDVTITASTWASFSSENALDFTGTGVTAYIAKAKDANNVTLTEITKVPAETGIVVNAAAGTHAIPVLTDAADETTGNLLKPWLTAGTPTADTYYTLAVSGTDPIFKKSSGGTLAAGKAYLYLSGTLAPVLNVSFENGDVTGIADVRSKMEDVRGEVYDLQGRKVAQPTKGLYIVNGRKVVIK